MRTFSSASLFAVAAVTLGMLGCMQGAGAQAAAPAGLGDQLFATGGDIKVEVLGLSSSFGGDVAA